MRYRPKGQKQIKDFERQKHLHFSGNKTAPFLINQRGSHFRRLFTPLRARLSTILNMTFLPSEFSIGIPIMNITSISHHPIRVGGSLAAALLVAGLQLSLVALPIGSLRAGGANEERNAFTWKNLSPAQLRGLVCTHVSGASRLDLDRPTASVGLLAEGDRLQLCFR